MQPDSYHRLESRIAAWAGSRPDIQAVLVVGSRARAIQPADELADLDLVLFSHEIQRYRQRPPSLDHIAPVWLAVPSQVNPAHVEWLVLFAGGFKVDFYFAPIASGASLAENLPLMPFQGVLARGLRVLVDRTGSGPERSHELGAAATQRTRSKVDDPSWPPTFQRFQSEADGTLLSATRAIKFIRRKDLWRVKFQVDTDLKRRLLTFIEWHAQATAERPVDTWYDGRFMSDWAVPDVLDALPQTFGAYEAGDLLRALEASLALFDRLARDTAGRLAYSYPLANQEAVLAWLDEQIELTRTETGQTNRPTPT